MTARSILLCPVAVFAVALSALSFAAAVAQENGNTAAPPLPAAQEERLTIETRDKATPAMRNLRLERTFRRAVPAGYASVVTPAQREQIYKIQEDYFEVIAMLELRLELLKQERDAKIEGVMTPAQLDQIQRPTRRTILPRVNRTE